MESATRLQPNQLPTPPRFEGQLLESVEHSDTTRVGKVKYVAREKRLTEFTQDSQRNFESQITDLIAD